MAAAYVLLHFAGSSDMPGLVHRTVKGLWLVGMRQAVGNLFSLWQADSGINHEYKIRTTSGEMVLKTKHTYPTIIDALPSRSDVMTPTCELKASEHGSCLIS